MIAALDRHVEQVLVHTGQNCDYELNQVFFEDLGIRQPDHYLEAAGATPAETIGQVIAREEGSVMLTGLALERVREGLAVLTSQPRGDHRGLRVPADYDVPNVSEKVVRIVLSYTDYVNRRVWHKTN